MEVLRGGVEPDLMVSGLSVESQSLANRCRRLEFSDRGEKQATITLYEPNFNVEHCSYIPVSPSRLAGREGRGFLQHLTSARMEVDEENPMMEKPQYREWEERSDRQGMGWVCHETGSFRSHVLGMWCMVGGERSLIRVKVPGERGSGTHEELDSKDFYFSTGLIEEGLGKGIRFPMFGPSLMVEYPRDKLELYGEDREMPARMIFFKYKPGYRMFSMGSQLPMNEKHFSYISRASGMPRDVLLEGSVTWPMAILGLIHSMGVSLQNECHIANFELSEDGIYRYVPDFGVAKRGLTESDMLDERDRLLDQLGEWYIQRSCFRGLGGSQAMLLKSKGMRAYEGGAAFFRGSGQ
ncbi:MAG: hypothetical protein GF416_00590 [Candidatus Altiarchaeales archaeon]|nr:hypothetical protein [Candidatus Altiarchaeales archaeon]MBD3415616.1 hypothetical protein [Candidatus Altiarchaeales archaeon]